MTSNTFIGSATYSLQDNRLRLYADARLDAETYGRVKEAGFRWAPKQELFVAPGWTTKREDLLIELCGEIGDEDYSTEDRAADRAERFGGYRDKRRSEAGSGADAFEAGPAVFGHQNQRRAERQAARHDRHRTGALTQWAKAEYWQERTAAVIHHALHKESRTVRRGRILVIEADLRRVTDRYTPKKDAEVVAMRMDDGEMIDHVWCGSTRAGGWVKASRLEAIKAAYARRVQHLEFRLGYENAMLEADGGKASDNEMVVGGFVGGFQIHKINKSPVTGAIVSVAVLKEARWHNGPLVPRSDGSMGKPLTMQTLNIQRLGEGVYRDPTEEELAKFLATKESNKATAKALRTGAATAINPTPEDARRLQDIWNTAAADRKKYGNPPEPAPVCQASQAAYTSNSKGDYGQCFTTFVKADGTTSRTDEGAVFKVRVRRSGGGCFSRADSVVVLTDKPQKSLPLRWGGIVKAADEARALAAVVSL